jgi:hypothetical protein
MSLVGATLFQSDPLRGWKMYRVETVLRPLIAMT